jgi:hypothetical protein
MGVKWQKIENQMFQPGIVAWGSVILLMGGWALSTVGFKNPASQLRINMKLVI